MKVDIFPSFRVGQKQRTRTAAGARIEFISDNIFESNATKFNFRKYTLKNTSNESYIFDYRKI